MRASPQLPNPKPLIREVRFLENDNLHVAEITLVSNQTQSPTYAGLRRHIWLARPDEWEYTVASSVGQYVVFCLSWASLQGGSIAVWSVASRSWEHCSQTEYAVAAMLVPELDAIITLHCVSNYITTFHHVVDFRPFRAPGCAATLRRKSIASGFDSQSESVLQTAAANASPSKFGPAGIFRYGQGDTFCAHDDGNRINFTALEILGALSKPAGNK